MFKAILKIAMISGLVFQAPMSFGEISPRGEVTGGTGVALIGGWVVGLVLSAKDDNKIKLFNELTEPMWEHQGSQPFSRLPSNLVERIQAGAPVRIQYKATAQELKNDEIIKWQSYIKTVTNNGAIADSQLETEVQAQVMKGRQILAKINDGSMTFTDGPRTVLVETNTQAQKETALSILREEAQKGFVKAEALNDTDFAKFKRLTRRAGIKTGGAWVAWGAGMILMTIGPAMAEELPPSAQPATNLIVAPKVDLGAAAR